MTLADKTGAEILNVADPIMDNLMEGSTEINHEKHTRNFTDRMKGIVTKEYFETVCRKYQAERGYFSRREFVSVFRRPQPVAIVWKQWFTKQPGEYVAELVLVENGFTYLGIWSITPWYFDQLRGYSQRIVTDKNTLMTEGGLVGWMRWLQRKSCKLRYCCTTA